MKAIVYHRYGGPDVLGCREIDTPAPGDDEVLVKVVASSVNPYDWHFMRGTPYLGRIVMGLRRPATARLGVDVAGRVEAAGRNAGELKPGEAVFGMCRGAFAEYATAGPSALIAKPDNVTFAQAAAAPLAAITALQALRDTGRLQPGQTVLINGAAGGVGTFAVQIAKALGAAGVTGVCSTRNVDLVRSIGADRVIDYTREDFTKRGERYDLIVDCVGNRSLSACRRALTRKGIYAMVGGPAGRWLGPFSRVLKMLVLSPFVSQRLTTVVAKKNKSDLSFIGRLIETGKVTPVIDRRYPLREVPEAIRYLEEGHARGKVIITMENHEEDQK